MRPSLPSPRRVLIAGLTLVLVASLAPAAWAQAGGPAHAPTRGPTLPAEDLKRIGEMAADSARAGQAVVELQAFLEKHPDGNYRQWAYNTLLLAQLRRKGPVPDVVSAAESLLTQLGSDYRRRVGFFASLAEVLADRADGLDSALVYARRARDEAPPTPDALPALAVARASEGLVLLRRGDGKGAIEALLDALPDAPDSQRVLTRLGEAYELTKRDDDAIRAYVNALGAYPGGDSSAYAPLRRAWTRRHGSLKGLDDAVRKAEAATMRQVAIEQRRAEQDAPDFTLPELNDTTRSITLASFKGRVLLIDFWGSWCGPCRAEMPLFQALAEKYKGRPEVAFLGINWERQGANAQRRDKAKAFADEMKVTFPNALDYEATVAKAFGVEGFPTVYVLDQTGKVRFANRGLAPRIDEILETQIESLLGH